VVRLSSRPAEDRKTVAAGVIECSLEVVAKLSGAPHGSHSGVWTGNADDNKLVARAPLALLSRSLAGDGDKVLPFQSLGIGAY
jgi:hypothetical protein